MPHLNPAALHRLALACFGLALAGCATRSAHVQPLPASPAEFAAWDCARIFEEADRVQQRAAETAWSVDERVGNNVIALGIGAALFWPALLAMRPDGPEAAELARLRGRDEALQTAARQRGCPPPGGTLPPERAARLPVAVGDRLVYEERAGGHAGEWVLKVAALRRDELEFNLEHEGRSAPWHQDPAGNVTTAPAGALRWHHLLRQAPELGQVLAGEIDLVGDPLVRGRVRGQVVAVGPQWLAGRHFDVAVIELFGDAQRGDLSTRLEGAIAVDRSSGVLLRLDHAAAWPSFNLQRRLSRVESTALTQIFTPGA